MTAGVQQGESTTQKEIACIQDSIPVEVQVQEYQTPNQIVSDDLQNEHLITPDALNNVAAMCSTPTVNRNTFPKLKMKTEYRKLSNLKKNINKLEERSKLTIGLVMNINKIWSVELPKIMQSMHDILATSIHSDINDLLSDSMLNGLETM